VTEVETEHTPGPWNLSEECFRDGLRSRLIYGHPEGMLAIVRVEHQGAYYGPANANLMVAAPALIEALTAACDLLDFCIETYGDQPGTLVECVANYRAVISQAQARTEGTR